MFRGAVICCGFGRRGSGAEGVQEGPDEGGPVFYRGTGPCSCGKVILPTGDRIQVQEFSTIISDRKKYFLRIFGDWSMVMTPWLPVSLSSETEIVLFGIAYFAWVISEIIGSIILPRIRHRRNGINLERKDKNSALAVNAGLIAAIFIAFAFSFVRIAVLPEWVFYPGIALMLGGIVLRQWSIAILGGFFSVMVSVQEGQTIIRKGPYRFIRHPSYTGTLLTMTGIGLAVQSWGALLILLLIFAIVYYYRIRIEEKALTEQFGNDYVAYTRETKMLIPFIL
jgi:protein-S-isoprenylcysteine O-methyltransferase Ste14